MRKEGKEGRKDMNEDMNEDAKDNRRTCTRCRTLLADAPPSGLLFESPMHAFV